MPQRSRAPSATAAVPSAAAPSDSSNPAPEAPSSQLAGAETAAAMPRMSWFDIRQYQKLFIAVAHAEIRQRGEAGTLGTSEQCTHIVTAYKRALALWYRDDTTLNSIANFPMCPQSLRDLGSETAAIRAMMSTTSTGNRSFTGEAMLNMAQDLKKKMLSLIATWNLACGHPALAATIARPGTGVLEETIYLKVVSIMYVQLRPKQPHCIFVTLIAGTESKKLSALSNCDVSILASAFRNQRSALQKKSPKLMSLIFTLLVASLRQRKGEIQTGIEQMDALRNSPFGDKLMSLLRLSITSTEVPSLRVVLLLIPI
jgi:hypothetical protein